LSSVWPLVLLFVGGLFFADVFHRRVLITGSDLAWLFSRPRTAGEVARARLQTRSPVAAGSAARQRESAPLAPAEPSPVATTPPAPEETSYSARLLQVKKSLRKPGE
jgi:hypothetical protein